MRFVSLVLFGRVVDGLLTLQPDWVYLCVFQFSDTVNRDWNSIS